MTYALDAAARGSARASRTCELKGEPMRADKRYKVAGWAPVAEGASGEPVWEVVARHLRALKTVPPLGQPAAPGARQGR